MTKKGSTKIVNFMTRGGCPCARAWPNINKYRENVLFLFLKICFCTPEHSSDRFQSFSLQEILKKYICFAPTVRSTIFLHRHEEVHMFFASSTRNQYNFEYKYVFKCKLI